MREVKGRIPFLTKGFGPRSCGSGGTNMGPATFPGNARPFARRIASLLSVAFAILHCSSASGQQPAWTDVTAGPTARADHAMAYDGVRDRTVLFGGNDTTGNYLSDTWEWDGMNWIQRNPASQPPARSHHAL